MTTISADRFACLAARWTCSPAKADAAGARFAIILGDDELAAGEAAVKDLRSGEQFRVALADLA